MRRILLACVLSSLFACSGSLDPEGERTSGSRATSGSTVIPTASPSPPEAQIDIGSLEGRIAFSDETNDIWTVRADGTHARRLTFDRAQQFDPTWAPDGTRIAYRHQTGDDQTTEIFVMHADGSHPRNVTNNGVADWGPAWSPDGLEIVWNSSVGTGGFGFSAYAMAPDGSAVRHLSRHFVEYPAWSPDGSRITFMAQEPDAFGNNPDYNVFVMNADGTEVRRLTTTSGSDGWPAWSPGGSQIVFSSTRDDCSISDSADCRSSGDIGPWQDVWIMNADGSDQRRVTSEFGQFLTWSPDGSAILVAGGADMFLIRPDGTGLTPFPIEGVSHPLFPDWIAG